MHGAAKGVLLVAQPRIARRERRRRTPSAHQSHAGLRPMLATPAGAPDPAFAGGPSAPLAVTVAGDAAVAAQAAAADTRAKASDERTDAGLWMAHVLSPVFAGKSSAAKRTAASSRMRLSTGTSSP